MGREKNAGEAGAGDFMDESIEVDELLEVGVECLFG